MPKIAGDGGGRVGSPVMTGLPADSSSNVRERLVSDGSGRSEFSMAAAFDAWSARMCRAEYGGARPISG